MRRRDMGYTDQWFVRTVLSLGVLSVNPFLLNLECSACAKVHSPRQLINLCPCGNPLLVRYDLPAVQASLPQKFQGSRPQTMWRYEELLPPGKSQARISLGEGGTPLVDAGKLASSLGLSRLWIKDESANPTGSFKARGLSAAVSMAKALGAERLAIPSAGNAGGALAAYAARAGMQAHVFMPRDVPPANRIECEALGARVHLVDGLITDCGRLAAQQASANGWFDVATLKEPYRIEGKKTLGLELAEQLQWRLPDVIIYPTGGGTGLVGMWKAFQEMRQLGWVNSKQPRMVSVQAAGCAPVVRGLRARQGSMRALDPGKHSCSRIAGAPSHRRFSDAGNPAPKRRYGSGGNRPGNAGRGQDHGAVGGSVCLSGRRSHPGCSEEADPIPFCPAFRRSRPLQHRIGIEVPASFRSLKWTAPRPQWPNDGSPGRLSMTDRLYFSDSYLTEFEARVLQAEQAGNFFEVRLDRTAFYPTSGRPTP